MAYPLILWCIRIGLTKNVIVRDIHVLSTYCFNRKFKDQYEKEKYSGFENVITEIVLDLILIYLQIPIPKKSRLRKICEVPTLEDSLWLHYTVN